MPLDTTWTATTADFITVLTALDGFVLAKRHYADGTSLEADNAKWFSSRAVPVNSLDDLVRVIEPLRNDPHSCIVPGKLLSGIDPAHHLRRKYAQGDDPATLGAAAHTWLPIDYEDKTGTGWLKKGNLINMRLPPELLAANCYVHLSGSAGIKQGVRLRLYYWLDKAITDDQAASWLGAVDENGERIYPAVDTSIYSPEHYIYTSRPLFQEGRPDPIKDNKREWLIEAGTACVSVPDIKVSARANKKENSSPEGTASAAELFAMLPFIDPACLSDDPKVKCQDLWLRRMCAIRNTEFFGKDEAWNEDMAVAWSAGEFWAEGEPANYPGEDKVRARYRTLTGGATFGSIVGAAQDGGWKPSREHIEYGFTPGADKQADPTKDENPFAAWGSPASFANRPDPTFWDPETKMLPRDDAEGATVFVYGQQSAGKTNVTLTWLLDIVAAGGRVLYAAGEGVTGVAKQRLPAHCTARKIAMDDLTNKFAMLPCVPLLQDKNQVAQFIAAIKPFAPNVVVIDTLATATAGMDENNSMFSSLLTANGAVGQIRRAYKATVIILAHEGKTDGRGIRGHSGLMGNVDTMLQVVSNRKHFITVEITKMRDGDSGKTHYYLTEPNTVPVPKRVDASEYLAAFKNAPVSQSVDDIKLQGIVINMAIKYATQDVVPVGDGHTSGGGRPIKLSMPKKAGEKVTKLAKDSKPFLNAVSTEMGIDVPENRIVDMLQKSAEEFYLHYHRADPSVRKPAGYHAGLNKWVEIDTVDVAAE